MPIVTHCPNPTCGQAYRLPDRHVGKNARCQRCQTRFFIRPGEGELVRSGRENKQSSGPGPSLSGQSQIGEETLDASETADHRERRETATISSEPPHAGATVAADTSDDQAQTPDLATSSSATAASDPAALKSAEDNVPLEWSKDEVILGLYEVKQVHHGGAMGLVYRVHHKSWNLDLAVKCPRPEFVDTEQKKAVFERECETWINLGLHPNTVSCYYVRRLGGIPRVFAEYVDGGDLKDWIEEGRLYEGDPEAALQRILDIAIQFAWGLKYAHDRGLVHQDVKPANVMMTADGTAKVSDFGLAKASGAVIEGAGAPANPQVTFGGMTEAFCSPEQANRQKLSHKTDIWSWAVSVFEMFTGEVTWPGGAVAGHSLESYLDEGLGDESKPKMPEGLAILLRHCFQKAPDNRPPSMQAIADELKKTYREVTGDDYPREEPKPSRLMTDGLNNQAVSMIDLGRKEEAVRLWKKVLCLKPGHPEATYNKALIAWGGAFSPERPPLFCQPRLEHVRLEVSNLQVDLASPDEIVRLGEAGLAAAIRLFREPLEKQGSLNQAVLAAALLQFAERGNTRAQDFLFDVAQGRVPLVSGLDGESAFAIAQSYVYGC